MSNACVSAWTACIWELQRLVSTASRGVAQTEVQAVQHALSELSQQPQPLPHAAWKKLVQDVQVTANLAGLCVQALALQQPEELNCLRCLAFTALDTWMEKAVGTMRTSPGSRAAAAVRQQLQESQLLQILGPAMDAAAAQLTAAATALAAAAAGCSDSSSSTAVPGLGSIREQMSCYEKADVHCGVLLKAFQLTSSTLSQQGLFTFETVLPAAPAAMRLILTGFQACGNLQRLWQQKKMQLPLKVGRLAAVGGSFVSEYGCLAMMLPGAVLNIDSWQSSAAQQLLLSPALLSSLAIIMIATVLGMVTSSGAGTTAAATPAASSRDARGVGSSSGGQVPGAKGQQQPRQANNRGGRRSSDRVLADSLTPLSCSVFDILGVHKETVIQMAWVLNAAGLAGVGEMRSTATAYGRVLEYQVEQAKGAFSAQLLLQLETDLLLSLAVLQLTSSIPDSYPGVQAAQELACQLCSCDSLLNLWNVAGLHKLPRPAAYTGPQLALQLLPSPFEVQHPTPALPQQRRRQQQQQARQQQPAEWCVLAPTSPLLAELLPLLTRFGFKKLQLQQQQEQWGMRGLLTLLTCSVVPAPGAAAAAEGSLPAILAASRPYGGFVTYSCVLHAQDAFLPHAVGIISFFEAVLRCDAARRDAASAAAAAGSAAGCSASTGGTAAAPAAAVQGASAGGDKLLDYGNAWSALCFHRTSGEYPHHPAPLALLGVAAGPGSQVQRQLHSLLATMVKLSGCSRGTHENKAVQVFRAAAGHAASALLAGAAADNQQQQLEAAGCSSGSAAAASMLPSVNIIGRCCMQWAGELQQEEQQWAEAQRQQGCDLGFLKVDTLEYRCMVLLSAVVKWLASGSTCDQLTAAGYAPMPVLRQLEQQLATCRVLQDSPSDKAGVLEAAQQLQSTGLALCSFAVPCMCNNPGCTSMAGLSELAAVSGRSCICGGCRVARYCGRVCQRAAWKQHKLMCGALSEAAGAAAAAAAAAQAGADVAAAVQLCA